MPKLIVPLTKSPHASGRVGPERLQDWFRGLVKAKALRDKHRDSKVAIISAVHVKGEVSEMVLYLTILEHLGIPVDALDRPIYRYEAQETIEQIRIAGEMAKSMGLELVFVSTWLHYWRVRYLTRRMRAEHHGAFGIPRPKEAITDIVLTLLFPILDVFGKREWFMRRVEKHRLSGKHGIF